MHMDKPFKNVITDRTIAFDRYIVIARYETEDEAKNNLEHDVKLFKEKYSHEVWYKMAYPWAWATIRDS